MKNKYESAEIEIVWLCKSDIITASNPESGEEAGNGGSIGGGGYDPDGWT